MSPLVPLLADGLVAVLLVATIASSVALSRRIKLLKADESAMRRTVGELMLATETAERAISGLRNTLGDCDRTLGERLRTAERYAADLASQVEAGETVMTRIAQIVDSSRQVSSREVSSRQVSSRQASASRPPAEEPRAPAQPSPVLDRLAAAAATAEALAERAARRLDGRTVS